MGGFCREPVFELGVSLLCPVYVAVSGKELDPELVTAGGQRESKSMLSFGVSKGVRRMFGWTRLLEHLT